MAGTYRKADGVVVPGAGGYLVWGVSGTDYAGATVEPGNLRIAGDEMDLVDAPGATAVTKADWQRQRTSRPVRLQPLPSNQRQQMVI